MDFESGDSAAFVKSKGGGTQWSTLYECDLRTLANQAILAAGASASYALATIDGQSWGIHLGQSQSSGNPTLAIQNGIGLVAWYNSEKSAGNNGYGGLHADLRVTQIPGYDAAKTTCCQVRFYRGPLLNAGGYTFTDTLMNSVGHVGAGIWSGTEAVYYGPGNGNETIIFDGAVSVRGTLNNELTRVPWVDRGPPNDSYNNVSDWVLATMASPWSMDPATTTDSQKDRNIHSFWYQHDVYGASLPDVEDMQCALSVKQASNGTAYANHLMGAYFGSAGGVVNACALTQIRVLQRAVKSL